MKLRHVLIQSPIRKLPYRLSSFVALLLFALGLAFIMTSPTRASVTGVSAWVIRGNDGQPDPSAVSPNQFQFAIGFIDSIGSPTIYFNNLSFGYTTSADGNVIASGSWPLSPDISYVSSDQPYIASANLTNLIPNTTYLTDVWAFDSGNRFDYEFAVTTAALRTPDTASTLVLLGGAFVGLATFRRWRPSLPQSALYCAHPMD